MTGRRALNRSAAASPSLRFRGARAHVLPRAQDARSAAGARNLRKSGAGRCASGPAPARAGGAMEEQDAGLDSGTAQRCHDGDVHDVCGRRLPEHQ